MPGLMACRQKYKEEQPFKGKRIAGSLHMTIQTGVLIESLLELGASLRWCSCNIHSTQDHAAAAIVKSKSAAVFAWKGETLDEYWDLTFKALNFGDGKGPHSIVDDGGDMTLMLLKGMEIGEEYEKSKKLPDFESMKEGDEKYLIKKICKEV